jgi:hypothetical protein
VRSPRAGIAGALLALSTFACVDGDVPARPTLASYAAGGGPEPIQLATGSGCGDVRLVVSGGNVYWTEKATGLVKSVPTAGGPTRVIARAQVSPGAIAAGESSLFWVAGNAVMKSPLAGGAASVFVKASTVPEMLGGENGVNALLVDQGELYFARFTLVWKVPVEGGPVVNIGRSPDEDMGKPAAFAIDETHLYQTEHYHNAVSREKVDGTQDGLLEKGATAKLAPDRIAISQGALLEDAIAVARGQVIWANGIGLKAKAVDFLEQDNEVQLATSADSNTISGFTVSQNGFTVTHDVIYFGEAVTNTVQMAPLGEATVGTVIVTGQWEPRQFAADDTAIYWHTADCKVMKLPK